jgi:hypothetical protein
VARAQKAEKFDALAQAALHHLRAGDHFGHDGCDLGRPEIELLVEVLDRVKNLAVAEMWIAQRRNLRS